MSSPQYLAAVIFDLDGTLVNSLDDLAAAGNAVLAARGLPSHEPDTYRTFIGNGLAKLVERALPAELRQPQVVAQATEEFRAHYGANWHQHARPYAGITSLLAALAQKGLPLAVLSNKAHDFAQLMVEHFFGNKTFAQVLGARPDRPIKPDPHGALQIARALGIEPAQWAFLGDSGVDMQTAQAAGMHAIGAAWGFRQRAELWENGAQEVLSEPGELLGLI